MNFSKRLLALLMILVMLFSLCACGDSGSSYDGGSDYTPDSDGGDTEEPDYAPDSTPTETGDTLKADGMKYVMIYNPAIYDENKGTDTSYKQSGTLGAQVDVNAYRGDDLTEEPEFIQIDQSTWFDELPDNIQLDDNRADPIGTDYQVGDVKSFIVSPNAQTFERMSFTCDYAGTYCHIWNAGNLTKEQAEDLGKEFDEKVYPAVTSAFGTPRFVSSEGGKVNLLMYTLPNSYLGFFRPLDLFTPDELPQIGVADVENYNTNHAILHINDFQIRAGRTTSVYSTLAHELQHLINFTAFFETANGAIMNTWINESMSGYIEEKLYTGSKEEVGHYESFNESDLIRNGQSLYNFKTDTSYFSFDIGVYGSVYYFSKYLEKNAGSDIFSNIHDYWRTSYSRTLSVPEALANAVPANFKTAINQSLSYPSSLSFSNKDEEFMSKLTLQFYLSLLSNTDNISDFENVDHQSILYDSIDGSDIEGGGRLIFAITGEEFTVPSDADSGLIYIGLDANFQPVTGILCK